MKTKKFILCIKWYKNDGGGDRRPICVDYMNAEDLKIKMKKILSDFRTNKMDVDYMNNGYNLGKIPYSVNVSN